MFLGEEESFKSLPDYVIIDVEEVTKTYHTEQSLVQAFQFDIDDLIEDCLNCIAYKDEADNQVVELVNALWEDLEAEGWADKGHGLLAATLNLGCYLKKELERIGVYSRNGLNYYEMKCWVSNGQHDALVLEKINQGEWDM